MEAQRYEAAAGAGSNEAKESGHRSASEGLQQQFGWMADQAKEQAAETLQPMKESARKVAQEQKNVFADRIGGFAKAMDAAAGECGGDSPAMSEMLSAAAGSMRSASDSLRRHHIDHLTGAMQHFAHHRPGALFAGALVAGFALSRFLKSSAPDRSGGVAR